MAVVALRDFELGGVLFGSVTAVVNVESGSDASVRGY